jgi:hypothetical protein
MLLKKDLGKEIQQNAYTREEQEKSIIKDLL